MKKILVPIDFSETSMNALAYSVELAKHCKAELFLLHCYYVPEFVHDSMFPMENAENNEKESWESLNDLKNSILKNEFDLKIHTFCSHGIATDLINDYAKQESIDLIVVGAHGAGYLEEKILGSTASTLVRSALIPVLVIDQHVKFRALKKIVLASDFVASNNGLVLRPLKKLVALFQSHLCVLNIYQNDHVVPSISEVIASFELDQSLEHTHHTFFYSKSLEIVEAINDFVQEQKMDMVVMIAHKHTLIERIFREPHTKTMAFHSKVPFLVLHE